MAVHNPRFRTLEIVLVAMFAALMAIGANVTSFIMIGAVPLTFQTFFSILAGALLGSRLGAMSMLVYTLIGLAGAPVFAGFSGGLSTFTKPTFGFILSFILLAYVTGKMIESKQNPTVQTFFFAAFVGLTINYVFGTNYLFLALKYILALEDVSYTATWAGMIPFLIKDIAMTIIVATIAPRVYKVIRKSAFGLSSNNKAAS